MEKRLDPVLKYSIVSAIKAVRMAGLDKEAQPDAYRKLDKGKVGVLIGSGMGGQTITAEGEPVSGLLYVCCLSAVCVAAQACPPLNAKGPSGLLHSSSHT